jgi:hypothetical protein
MCSTLMGQIEPVRTSPRVRPTGAVAPYVIPAKARIQYGGEAPVGGEDLRLAVGIYLDLYQTIRKAL